MSQGEPGDVECIGCEEGEAAGMAARVTWIMPVAYSSEIISTAMTTWPR
jgi:hypothetical protein